MIRSMTGFGRSEYSDENKKIVVEMKSVNHRYNEVSIRMPKVLNFYEAGIRTLLKQYISRGKVDMFITYEDLAEGKTKVVYHEDVAKEYFEALQKMKETFGLDNDIRLSTLSRYPEVLTVEEQSEDENEIWTLLEKVIKGACEQFVSARVTEGEKLKLDLLSKLDYIESLVDEVEKRSPEIIAEHRQKLYDKVAELIGDAKIEQSLLVTEITLYADKICTDEETVRLRSHVNHVRETLAEGENVGRKLDFIAQEMNREANTILSKANDITVSNIAISLKTEIEKIREQIQNIE